jgi:HEPN superfamily Toprim-like protein
MYLALGNFEVDWSNRFRLHDFGDLFQTTDIRKVVYRGTRDRTKREALVKPLRDVSARLDLLGYTLTAARIEYESLTDHLTTPDFRGEVAYDLSFAGLLQRFGHLNVSKIKPPYVGGHYSVGEFFAHEVAPRIGLKDNPDGNLTYFSESVERFRAELVLRMLAENPANLDLNVVWYIDDHLDSHEGIDRDFFVRPLAREKRFLLVTEGRSDARILSRAFAARWAGIKDFVYFVDMESGYPFSGTGNLYKFCQGLVAIGLQNKTVVIYDNDAEGLFNYQRTNQLSMPPTMRTIHLPDLPDDFILDTIGPDGPGRSAVNGTAGSIEAYLDWSGAADKPTIRWANYIEASDRYQGAIQGKDRAEKLFNAAGGASLHYDYSRIDSVLAHIVTACISIVSPG